MSPQSPVEQADAPDVSIIMPCLDEELTLPHCLNNAREALNSIKSQLGLSGEIVIADNGSTDQSRKIAEDFGARVVSVAEKGYGSAIRGGMAGARGKYLVMGDADGSYDFRESLPMIEHLTKGADLCMGSRLKGKILPGAMPWKNRHIGNPVLTGVLNVLFRSGMSDAHCGLRALTKDAFHRLGLTSSGMEFASEMVIKAALLNLKRAETPATLHPDLRDRPPHLRPWRDGWRHLRYILTLSPNGLFFLPAFTVGATALTLLLVLVFAVSGEVITVGPLHFGDHWLPISIGMLVSAHMMWLFGVAATFHSVKSNYRKLGPIFTRFLPAYNLETMLLTAGALFIISALGFIFVLVSWAAGDFGSLDKTRELGLAVAFMVISLQHAFGGFLIHIIRDDAGGQGPRTQSGAFQ